MNDRSYDVLVLAAGRGASDPMTQASGASHKCLLPVAGVPMLIRVLGALAASRSVRRIFISIEDPSIIAGTDGLTALRERMAIEPIASAERASSSVGQALRSGALRFPVLVTTADHALLTPAMVDDFCTRSTGSGADLTAGLAEAATILDAYPGAARTFLKFADGRYSGCNLFAFNTMKALNAVDFWKRIEQDRKQPWRLIGAFGIMPLLIYLTGRASLSKAFELGSKRLDVIAKPIIMPQAEAAIDVDKPADLELVESILATGPGNAG